MVQLTMLGILPAYSLSRVHPHGLLLSQPSALFHLVSLSHPALSETFQSGKLFTVLVCPGSRGKFAGRDLASARFLSA